MSRANPQAEPQALPLLFSFKQVIVGSGFVAGVRMNGRALLETELVEEKEECWITGIAPVGIVGGGADRSVAFSEFRKSWTEVVFDLASQASDFKAFKAACLSFLKSSQDDLTKLWCDAVAEVRKNHYADPSLKSEKAEQKVTFEVVDLSKLNKDGNEVENGLRVAA